MHYYDAEDGIRAVILIYHYFSSFSNFDKALTLTIFPLPSLGCETLASVPRLSSGGPNLKSLILRFRFDFMLRL